MPHDDYAAIFYAMAAFYAIAAELRLIDAY